MKGDEEMKYVFGLLWFIGAFVPPVIVSVTPNTHVKIVIATMVPGWILGYIISSVFLGLYFAVIAMEKDKIERNKQ